MIGVVMLLRYVPDSPRSVYLKEKRRRGIRREDLDEESKNKELALREDVKLRMQKFWKNIEQERGNIDDVNEQGNEEKNENDTYADNWNLLMLLKDEKLRFDIFITCMVNLCQQLSGINIVSIIHKYTKS